MQKIYVFKKNILIRYFINLVLFFLFIQSRVDAFEANYSKVSGITSIGINGHFIAFSQNKTNYNFEHLFNLGDMSLQDKRLADLAFNKIEPARGEYSLTTAFDDKNHSRLELRHLGVILHIIDWSNLRGKEHNIFGFLKGGLWITGGNNGALYIFNNQAESVATLEGHNGKITALAYNGKWLVSGDDNGLIILWDLDDVVKGRKKLSPYLSLLYSKDEQWIIWSKEGFFSSSDSGHLLLNVPERDPKIYRNPLLLAKKISSPTLFHRLAAAKLNNDKAAFNAPLVALVTPPKVSLQRDLNIVARVCDNGGGVQSATLYLRGVPVALEEIGRGLSANEKHKRGALVCNNYTKTISLADGENEIVLVANNDFGNESIADKVVITYQSEKSKKPNLHIATIAVANYADTRLNLKYPVSDAEAVVKAFENNAYGVFDRVYIHSLYDNNATRKNIEGVFRKLKNKVSAEDVFILFIAGHGFFPINSSEYFFIPHDMQSSRLTATSIGTDEWMKLLANVRAAQTLLLIDTCQSGGFDGFSKEIQQVQTAQLKFVHRLGRASLMASTKEQVAFEGVRGHGAFTSILLDALGGAADYTGDKQISVDELSVYISKHLPQLTERKWGYRQEAIRNTTGHDFVLGVIRP